MNGQMDIQMNGWEGRRAGPQVGGRVGGWVGRQADLQTGGQAGWQTGRYTDRQTDRQNEGHYGVNQNYIPCYGSNDKIQCYL